MHSQNCKGCKETFGNSLVQPSAGSRANFKDRSNFKVRSCCSGLVQPSLKISQDGDFTVSLGNLLQHLITLRAQKLFLWWHRISLAAAWAHAQVLVHPLYNQPSCTTNSPLAFPCSGWKRPAPQDRMMQPLKHLVGLSWACSSLPTSLLYCKTQRWSESSAALILCSHRTEGKKVCYRAKNPKHRKS